MYDDLFRIKYFMVRILNVNKLIKKLLTINTYMTTCLHIFRYLKR